MTKQMRFGLCVPQGYFNEFDDVGPRRRGIGPSRSRAWGGASGSNRSGPAST